MFSCFPGSVQVNGRAFLLKNLRVRDSIILWETPLSSYKVDLSNSQMSFNQLPKDDPDEKLIPKARDFDWTLAGTHHGGLFEPWVVYEGSVGNVRTRA